MRDHEQTQITRDTRGAVYVEFLLVFIPVFFMFLGMLQAALMYVGQIATQHAATTACRAAIVVLDDHPAEYNGEARNELEAAGGGDSGDGMDAVTGFLETAGLSGGAAPPGGGGGGSGGARLSSIRNAASIPLLSVSPSMGQLVGDQTIYRAIGGNPAERALVGAALYNRTAVAVTFPTAPRADSFRTSFGPNDPVTVRVTYLFHCGIPLVSRVMCDDMISIRSGIPIEQIRDLSAAAGSGSPDRIAVQLDRIRTAEERLGRAQTGMDELERGAEAPWLSSLTLLTGARFVVMRAEATMPNQGADYEYAGGE